MKIKKIFAALCIVSALCSFEAAALAAPAQQKPASIDGRNKASYEMCCRLAPMLQDSPLPFV